MTHFPKTQEALSEFYANSPYGVGEHTRPQPKAGTMGQILGHKPFDPAVHNLEDIDPLAVVDDESMGPHYVQEVLPDKPFYMSVVSDRTSRFGADALLLPKVEAIDAIAMGMDSSLVGATDYAHIKETKGNSREVFAQDLSDSARQQLTFGVSDFHGMHFDKTELEGVVAIKVNHLLERGIPQNVGFISLGGAVELNTGDKKQLDKFNAKLEEHHLEIVDGLEQAGAEVVSVIVDSRMQDGFDVEGVDSAIAEALDQFNR